MNEIPFPYFPIQFGKDGNTVVPGNAEVLALREHLQNAMPTDLIVISHGWNNDMAQAKDLYAELLGNAEKLIREGKPPGLKQRKFAVLGVLWPSKKFADAELIPGNAAGTSDSIDLESLKKQIQLLRGGFDAEDADKTLEAMAALLSKLKNSDSACEKFVELAQSLLPRGTEEADDGSALFFTVKPLKTFKNLENPISFSPPANPEQPTGGAMGLSGQPGSALGVGDFFSGIFSAARNILNYTTYYQMKARAGLIGSTALNPILRAIAKDLPALRIHLVGHSFGGRLVTAAVAGENAETILTVQSMSLLQGAFSHYGFAKNWDKRNHDGYFRRVVTQGGVSGPIIITHTHHDTAVGIAYPIASLLAGQNSAALGDKNSEYGGMGRNGAQMTPEAIDGDMGEVGKEYRFQPGKLHNLNALNAGGDFIKEHGDVRNREVAYAVLNAIAATKT